MRSNHGRLACVLLDVHEYLANLAGDVSKCWSVVRRQIPAFLLQYKHNSKVPLFLYLTNEIIYDCVTNVDILKECNADVSVINTF